MHKRLWILLLVGLLLMVGCAESMEEETAVVPDAPIPQETESDEPVADQPADDQPAASVPDDSLQTVECPFPVPGGYDIVCSLLTVPENRSRADSDLIELAVAIVRAPAGAAAPPLVYLAGGPGGSALDDFAADPEGWQYPFTENRDLILIDQRGTGYSFPTLDCPELAEEVAFDDENPEAACRQRLLAEGIDLSAYNTAENAADMTALRTALGIAEWDVLGISYGTRLALAMMRDHPAGLRSVILDSPFPPNADTPGEEAINTWESLQTLFADCARDSYCDENYPDLETVFLDTVAQMNEAPVDDIYGDDFAFIVAEALNDTSLIPLAPYAIYGMAEGDVEALMEIASEDWTYGRYQDNPDVSDSEGMYNSVICRDEYTFGDYESAEDALLATAPPELEAMLLQSTYDLFQVCDYWGAGAADAVENEAVHSDIPTLILVGQYDHATPPKWARLAAATLSNAYLYEVPGAGHSLLSSDECAIQIADDFLTDPTTEPDGRCLSDIEWPYFE